MKEYIEREAAVQELEVLRQEYEMHDDCDELVARRCRNAVSALPAADVAPVRHGRWEQHPQSSKNEPVYTCSLCKLNVSDFEKRWLKYCPNCGALMREVGNGEK